MGPYYGNPLSLGIANSSGNLPTTPTFGTALINVTGIGGTTGSPYGGLAGAGGAGGAAIANQTMSASSYGTRRAPAYMTTLGFTNNFGSPSRTQTDLQQVFSNSARLTSGGNIRVEMDGPTVVLRGTVADDHERRLAEAMARLTPGVRDLRNELSVRAASASP
jgi:osmotically-inducible protein OsmY